MMMHAKVAKQTDATYIGVHDTLSVTLTTTGRQRTDWAGADDKICVACHDAADLSAFTVGANNDTPHMGSDCNGCHFNNHSASAVDELFKGAGEGGPDCANCHGDYYSANTADYSLHSQTAGINYKHYMSTATELAEPPTYQLTIPDGTGTNSASRRCTMCHVTHSIFMVSGTSTAGRGFNLRHPLRQLRGQRPNTDLSAQP
jgi:hypothetical protein